MKPKKIMIFTILFLSIFISIGYSSFSKKLGIEDLTAIVREQKDTRITKLELDSNTANAISTYEEFDRDNISLGITLPEETSTIKYKVTLTNYGNVKMLLESITGLPDNLQYTIDGYQFNDSICNSIGQCILGISKDIYIKLYYTDNKYDSNNTKFNIKLDFNFKEIKTEFLFDYKGEEETFTVPYNGYYKLEVWGAQGGAANSYIGGYGGYSSGIVELSKDETLYINIGGEGEGSTKLNTASQGGYNGGGSSIAQSNDYTSGGGGATHISKSTGLLSNLSEKTSDILIVAGGGGGGFYYDTFQGTGGSGGGMNGNTGTVTNDRTEYIGYGGTQTAAGIGQNGASSGTFGKGGSSDINGGAGGGGGYYGGAGAYGGGAGGGSGYIGNALLIDKVMYCYNCAESSEESSKTISTENYSQTPITKYAKSGDGYVKITYIGVSEAFEYSYTGEAQTFVVPVDGTYQIELWGAQGGNYDSTYSGGLGGYTQGIINLSKDYILYVYVGQTNECVDGSLSILTKGGYNGGGSAGVTSENWPHRNFCGGGGATDIRLVSGAWNNFDSLKSRIMVAAGGGGANYYADGFNGIGGSGGGLSGYASSGFNNSTPAISLGATQISGSSFGRGGRNTTNGGGGGYYGGASNTWSGGAGGSSYISGHDGCDAISSESSSSNIIHTGQSIHYSGIQFTNTTMIDGLGYQWTNEIGTEVIKMPSYDNLSSMIGNIGNGYAKITLIKAN